MIILKYQLNNPLNIAILKKNWHTTICSAKCHFFLHKFISRQFLYIVQGFLYQLKILILPVLLLKWNKTCCIEFCLVKVFVSLVKLLIISLDEYCIFLGHLKSVFQQWSGVNRKEYTSTSFQGDQKYIISCDRRYPAAQVQIWRNKVRLISASKVICFIYSKFGEALLWSITLTVFLNTCK